LFVAATNADMYNGRIASVEPFIYMDVAARARVRLICEQKDRTDTEDGSA
jgi:hypothetical protein